MTSTGFCTACAEKLVTYVPVIKRSAVTGAETRMLKPACLVCASGGF